MKALFGGAGLIALVVAVIVAMNALFVIDEAEQAIKLQFGEPVDVIREPGLNFKIPFLQNVVRYDKRVLNMDPAAERFILADQKPLMVDYFVRYRIEDPLVYFRRIRTEAVATNRLTTIVNARMRDLLGQHLLTDILSEERVEILSNIVEASQSGAKDFGIEVVDVRIGKADLPPEISQTVYTRMTTERAEDAAEFRAQGKKAALEIRAEADRQATVLLAKANREAQILRGQGEAARTEVLNEAYGEDPEFYDFFRSLEAYREAMAKRTEPLIVTTENDFFKQFNSFESGNSASGAQ